jgi:hypothetical protein
MRPALASAVALVLVLAASGRSLAASPAEAAQPLAVSATWQVRDGNAASIIVPLGGVLTSKQKDMINGGFTTVSQLTLRLPSAGAKERDDDELPGFYSVRCSVKFDAWEETYDIARLDDRPRTALVKDFTDYGDLCLKAEINRPELLQPLAAHGGTILARLIVKQTSNEEADRIKDWLIQQQSGVMQGLFSHMLGELSLNQTLSVRVSVPPKPATAERTPNGKLEPAGGDARESKRKG